MVSDASTCTPTPWGYRRRSASRWRNSSRPTSPVGIGTGAASIPSTSRPRRVLTQEHEGFKLRASITQKGCYIICPPALVPGGGGAPSTDQPLLGDGSDNGKEAAVQVEHISFTPRVETPWFQLLESKSLLSRWFQIDSTRAPLHDGPGGGPGGQSESDREIRFLRRFIEYCRAVRRCRLNTSG